MGERIGFIGVGLMGHGMAKNILEKGYALTVLGLWVLVSLVSAFDDADDCFVELPEHPAIVPTSMAAAMMPAAICFAVVRNFIFPLPCG